MHYSIKAVLAAALASVALASVAASASAAIIYEGTTPVPLGTKIYGPADPASLVADTPGIGTVWSCPEGQFRGTVTQNGYDPIFGVNRVGISNTVIEFNGANFGWCSSWVSNTQVKGTIKNIDKQGCLNEVFGSWYFGYCDWTGGATVMNLSHRNTNTGNVFMCRYSGQTFQFSGGGPTPPLTLSSAGQSNAKMTWTLQANQPQGCLAGGFVLKPTVTLKTEAGADLHT